MSGAADESLCAHPVHQGRLGQDVHDVLHLLAGMADLAHVSEADDRERRLNQVAGYTVIQLSYLADRREEVGRLCPAVAGEFRMAETIIKTLKELAVQWKLGDVKVAVSGTEEQRETILPRSEYLQAMILHAEFIRKRFAGDTAQRWKELARTAAREQSQPRRMVR